MKDESYCHKNKARKIKIVLFVSFLVLLATIIVMLIFFISKLKDNTRNSYQKRGIEYSEIVKKNYIDGFNRTSTTGNFSYTLPDDDINELLAEGTESIDDKYIQSIYFKTGDAGERYFYVDLQKVVITTRVVITTTPALRDSSSVYLTISDCRIGKVNAVSYLQRKGYLTSNFIDTYFEKCHLPITYDETRLSFVVSPYKWVDSFPNTTIGDFLFEDEDKFSLNSNLLGFDLDISKLKTSSETYKDVNSSDIPNVYENVKNRFLSNYDTMSDSETRTIYALSEEDLNKLIKYSFNSNQKEEIVSQYTTNKIVFDLKGVNSFITQEDKITFKFFYSINGYLIDFDAFITYTTSESSNIFKIYFEYNNSYTSIVNTSLNNLLNGLSNEFTLFSCNGASKTFILDLSNLNGDLVEPDYKYCQKDIVINPSTHTIDFQITK